MRSDILIKQNGKRSLKLKFLESLQDAFVLITPALKDMIQGKRVTTPDATYRIKGLR
jgi:hypothetical protein